MFSFDVTLLIQAFHFFIAWCLIDRYLFKFLIVEIEYDQAFIEGLKNKQIALEGQVKVAEREKEDAWQRFKNGYKHQIPALFNRYNISQANGASDRNVKLQELSLAEKKQLVSKISETIVTKVIHDI